MSPRTTKAQRDDVMSDIRHAQKTRHSLDTDLTILNQMLADLDDADRERDEARETNRTLNRRNQELESFTADFKWVLERYPQAQGYEFIAGKRMLEQFDDLRAKLAIITKQRDEALRNMELMALHDSDGLEFAHVHILREKLDVARSALVAAKREHPSYCDSMEGALGSDALCDCGAREHNALIDKALSEIEVES